MVDKPGLLYDRPTEIVAIAALAVETESENREADVAQIAHAMDDLRQSNQKRDRPNIKIAARHSGRPKGAMRFGPMRFGHMGNAKACAPSRLQSRLRLPAPQYAAELTRFREHFSAPQPPSAEIGGVTVRFPAQREVCQPAQNDISGNSPSAPRSGSC
jgi:hypothetical protein